MRRKCTANATQILHRKGFSITLSFMNTHEKLHLILAEGESYKIEFKEKLSNLDKEIVAFANASGGSLFLGVNDDGMVIGIDITNKLKSQVQDIARNCDPSINIQFTSHKDQQVLEVVVAEGVDKPYRCKDGFFLRIGPSSQKLKRDEIIHLINQHGKIRFDEAINNKFDFEKDFSEQQLTDYLKISGIRVKALPEDILISINAAKEENNKLQMTNAGLLFFAENPQQFFPESYITCVRYQSFDRFSISDKKDFMGTPIQQIEDSLAFILKHIEVGVSFDSKSQ